MVEVETMKSMFGSSLASQMGSRMGSSMSLGQYFSPALPEEDYYANTQLSTPKPATTTIKKDPITGLPVIDPTSGRPIIDINTGELWVDPATGKTAVTRMKNDVGQVYYVYTNPDTGFTMKSDPADVEENRYGHRQIIPHVQAVIAEEQNGELVIRGDTESVQKPVSEPVLSAAPRVIIKTGTVEPSIPKPTLEPTEPAPVTTTPASRQEPTAKDKKNLFWPLAIFATGAVVVGGILWYRSK
jgi:hypothetical protein